jgi:CHAT domain-containing protein
MFLSCCLGARNATRAGRGDFYSFPHALSQAGAPINVGHRWEVNDDSARLIAEHFYRVLFHDFCPRRALLRARQNCAVENAERRDDAAWASPVLLMDA